MRLQALVTKCLWMVPWGRHAAKKQSLADVVTVASPHPSPCLHIGWFAWPSANWSSPDCGLYQRCVAEVTFGPQLLKPPHLVTFTRSSGIDLRNITLTNPAFWGLQHFFCNDSYAGALTILAPRWTRQIAGFMPFSVRNYTVEHSYVHVGDDAVAIMSGPDWKNRSCGSDPTSQCAVDLASPRETAGVIFRNLFVRGRSVAIGSEDFGNVTNVLFDKCTIGDDYGSCPWAFKIKMHVNVGCYVGDVVIRDTRFGNIRNNTWQDPGNDGGTALLMGMSYGSDGKPDPRLPQPRLGNISFINVTANSTRLAGNLAGAEHDIFGLHFRDCHFHATDPKPWSLHAVDTNSCTSVRSTPPFPTTTTPSP